MATYLAYVFPFDFNERAVDFSFFPNRPIAGNGNVLVDCRRRHFIVFA